MTTSRRIRRPDMRARHTRLGAVVIVAAVAITYTSYTANQGLPFQPHYDVKVDVPNANRLIKTADVRIGGVRVGQVAAVDVDSATPARSVRARLALQLDSELRRLPIDTGVTIRSAGVLGQTYVELTPGRSTRTVPDGGAIPAARVSQQIQLTDLLEIFDRRTAEKIQATLTSAGDGLAGRGSAINATLASLAASLDPVSRISARLNAPATHLPRLIAGTQRLAAALLPVRDELAGLIRNGATTADAVARERAALATTIDRAPRTLTQTRRALTAITPALDELAELSVALRPAGSRLRGALHAANGVLRSGIEPLGEVPRLTAPTTAALRALAALARRRATLAALTKTQAIFGAVGTLMDVFEPAQVQCNILPLWDEGTYSVFGHLGFGNGPAVANLIITGLGAEGEVLQNKAPSPNVAINYLPHVNRQECEANNSPYDGHQVLGNPPGLQPAKTRDTRARPDAIERARQAGLLDDPVPGP